jgi:hypothetical protein
MICVVSIAVRSATNPNILFCTRTEAAFRHLLLAILGSVLVPRASVMGWCRWMLQENLRVAGGGKQPKRYRHFPTPRFAGTSPSSLRYAQGILPDPDSSVTPSSRPLRAPIPPSKTLSRIIAAGPEYQRIDDDDDDEV